MRKYGNIENLIVVGPHENPDVLLYSIFGNEHINYPNVRRVFFSGEPFGIRADADFNFTFDRTSDVNIRFPLWLGYLNDYLSANDVIVGDKSNATYTITSIDTNPLKSLLIVTTPNPINAEPDDEFGFSETVTNFPNIV